MNAPLSVDLRLAGLVEAWASGCSWEEVMKDCSLDDGDVARLLTRTVDLLRQVGARRSRGVGWGGEMVVTWHACSLALWLCCSLCACVLPLPELFPPSEQGVAPCARHGRTSRGGPACTPSSPHSCAFWLGGSGPIARPPAAYGLAARPWQIPHTLPAHACRPCATRWASATRCCHR